MSVLHCDVQLDYPKAVYEPGDRLTGRVILTLEVRLLLKAVGIKYTGFAEVKWETLLPPKKAKKSKKTKKQRQEQPTNAEKLEQRVEVYTNREDFLSNVNYFMGSEEASGRIVDRGTYTYPFTVALPQSCPSSFESSNGHIRYMIEVFVDHKNKSEIWYKQQLHVIKPLEIHHSPCMSAQPRDVHVAEHLFWKVFKKPLEICVNLQQVGFVPGEAISVLVTIQNPEKLSLNELTFELHQICRITASHGYKKTKTNYFTTILAKTVQSVCDQREVKLQQLETLFVPQTVPTTDPNDCHCLQISYELIVRLSTNNEKRWLQAKLPITVGTVSLQSVEQAQQLQQVYELDASLKATTSNMSPSAFTAATAPDPETPDCNVSMISLASSTFRDAEYLPKTKFDAEPKRWKRKHLNQTDFTPKYLYYDMDNVTSIQNIEPTTIANATGSPNYKETD